MFFPTQGSQFSGVAARVIGLAPTGRRTTPDCARNNAYHKIVESMIKFGNAATNYLLA